MFSADQTILLIIDVQGNLANAVEDKRVIFKNIKALIQAARLMEIPIIYTEQVPEKIGATIPEIKKLLSDLEPVVKENFSCCGEQRFWDEIRSFERKQVIITGIEAHVCVFQTASDLLDSQYEVAVVEDAVSSRNSKDRQAALERIGSLGGIRTTMEMAVCELLRGAGHPRFKDVLNIIK